VSIRPPKPAAPLRLSIGRRRVVLVELRAFVCRPDTVGSDWRLALWVPGRGSWLAR